MLIIRELKIIILTEMFELQTKNYSKGVMTMQRLLTFGYTSVLHRHYKTVEQKTNIYK